MKIFFQRSGLKTDRTRQLHRLEQLLGVRFRRLALLNQALVHRSFMQTLDARSVQGDNETLEFLGDAVLGLVISEELFRGYPVSEVGELAKVKAQVVSRVTLSDIAKQMELDQWILMGPGEATQGEARRPSVIGSALEAVFGALFLDQGFATSARLIKKLFRGQIQAVEEGRLSVDYKSLLQEYALRYFKATPEYRVIGEIGPSHRRHFQVAVVWRGKTYGQGEGPSKKAASQEAARVALDYLLAPLS